MDLIGDSNFGVAHGLCFGPAKFPPRCHFCRRCHVVDFRSCEPFGFRGEESQFE
jgi:hypothetical protein